MRASLVQMLILVLALSACKGRQQHEVTETDSIPEMFPDYSGVTIPPNIAPLNFRITDGADKVVTTISGKNGSLKIVSDDNRVIIPSRGWSRLLNDNLGESLVFELTVLADGRRTSFRPFRVRIAEEPVDGYLVYRNLMPGFQNWNSMGIYQRDLSSFDVETVIDSRLLPGTCMNCPSFFV